LQVLNNQLENKPGEIMLNKKPRIKAVTTVKQIMDWLADSQLTYLDFLEQLAWRQKILSLERAVIKKSML